MSKYILDLESDGLIPQMTKIHCIVLKNIDTGEVISCADQPGYPSLETALDYISEADLLVFHNGIKFDIPALKKIYSGLALKPTCQFYDTLISSRLFWPELEPVDRAKWSHIEAKYLGRHSLAAWGERLGVAKIKFTENAKKDPAVVNVWAEWSAQMQVYCMAGHHKFLRDDLSWVPCKDINEGDTILGFDEFPEKQTGRCFKPTKIIKKTTDQAELFRVTLKSGKTFDVTAEHKWLVRNYKSRSSLQNPFEARTQLVWVETKDLMESKCFAIKYMNTWEDVKTWEAGYLAGIFDGEGSVRRHQKWDRLDYSFAQKPGVVHDLACKIISNLGFKYTTRKVLKINDCDCIRVVGTCYEKLRLLGMIKPARLIKNAQPFERLGRCEVKGEGDFDEIISVTSIGMGVIYKISTDAKTFVLDGYAHHNCEGDVEVSDALYKYMLSQTPDPRSLELEHEFAIVMSKQEQFGFPFNEKAAFALVNTLKAERSEIDEQLQEVFPPIVESRVSAKTGKPLKSKVTVFNPASRQQTAERLQACYPEIVFNSTDKGNVKVDDDVLEFLGEKYPEAKILARYQLLNKRIAQIADGKEAWLKHCQIYGDGRIHGEVVTNACVSGRCSHKRPNMAQVPSVGHAYGAECRSLFYAPEGWQLVGADASGLELRALGAWLAYFDGGEYARLVSTDGFDIHTHNARLFGIYSSDSPIEKATRDLSKRLIYCVPVDNTQVLTKTGWKTYEQLKVGELVLTYNQEKNIKEWKPILHIVDAYEDEVWEMSHNHSYKVQATADHRWYVNKRTMSKTGKSWSLKNGRYMTPMVETTAEINTESNIIVNAPLVEEACDGLNVDWDWPKYGTNWAEKILQMNSAQRRAWLSGFMLADGHQIIKPNQKPRWVISQLKNEHYEAALLAAYLEFDGHLHVSQSVQPNGKTKMQITISTRGHVTGQKLKKECIGKKKVFCISTENESFVMRQGETITITGNCILYGGGARKTGSIVDPSGTEDQQYRIGKKTIDTFYKNLPAIKKLKDLIDERVDKRGYLSGIDGRRLQIRSKHSALNQLLQSTGAVTVKKATTILYNDLITRGLKFGKDWGFVAHVHDEFQTLVRPEYVELYKELAIDSFRKSGEYFNLKCPMTGEARVGQNWEQTH